MATGACPLSVSGCVRVNTFETVSGKSSSFVKTSVLTFPRKLKNHQGAKRNLTVLAEYGEHRGDGGSDFVAGFLLGGAIFGTLAYVYGPKIRKSILNEDEYGFRRPRGPIYYYDDGLERTRQTLNEKISQLNSAIENVSSRLRGGKKTPPIPVEIDPEEAAT